MVPSVKEGYEQLAPGAAICVQKAWLQTALASVHTKKAKKNGNSSPCILLYKKNAS